MFNQMLKKIQIPRQRLLSAESALRGRSQWQPLSLGDPTKIQLILNTRQQPKLTLPASGSFRNHANGSNIPLERCFYSTGPSPMTKRDERNINLILLDMTKQGRINYKKIEEYLAKIERETNVTLQEKVFFLMVKNFSSKQNIQAAEAAERLVFNWMLKFYQQGRLDKAPKENLVGMILQAWVQTKHPKSAKRAQELLDKMEHLSHQGALQFALDARLYGTVMKAYAIQGDYANAKIIFDRCLTSFEQGNESARPNIVLWSTLLDACAKSGKPDAWRTAQEVFIDMQMSYQSGKLKQQPDSFCYSTLINACAKSKQLERAEFWMESMFKDYKAGNTLAQPNLQCMSPVLDAWSKLGTVEGAERSEKILNRMRTSTSDGVLPVQPNFISYNSVINAYAKAKQPERAECWLEEMLADYDKGVTSKQPDVKSFNMVLDAWVKSNQEDSIQRGQLILIRLKQLFKEGNIDAQPDAILYSALINACASTNQLKKALFWLEEMIKDYENGNFSAQPKAHFLTALYKGLTRTGNAERIHQISNRLQDIQQKGGPPAVVNRDAGSSSRVEPSGKMSDRRLSGRIQGEENTADQAGVQTLGPKSQALAGMEGVDSAEIELQEHLPDVEESDQRKEAKIEQEEKFSSDQGRDSLAHSNAQTLAAELEAWAGAETVEGAERSGDILNHMKDLARKGTPSSRPSAVNYNMVIDACAKSDQPEKAEYWLEVMFTDYKEGNSSSQPDVNSFNNVLDAWARSGSLQGAQRSEDILNHMVQLTSDGTLPVMPDSDSYSCVIQAWASANQPHRAEFWHNEMVRAYEAGNETAQPHINSFRIVLNAWERSDSDEATQRTERFLEHMDKLAVQGAINGEV